MSSRSDKAGLRTALKARRLTLSTADRQAKSQAICERLIVAADWSALHKVHYFRPITELGEPDVGRFIASLQARGTEMYSSRKIGGVWHMVDAKDEPMNGLPRFDAIIVPMLGFDPETLHRIGYGGGYYDKLLATQPQARKIGICFDLGLVKDIPAEAHDVPLEIIVTEARTYPL
ncbi:MAG TPA: 5-formyltetrahydrofolate cyclo-ligase [Verrucomicrobiae bacterium]|nr:5-formyltetrahydrofolate cyclo-ligase [Verrucomicrobiae bacterium]